MAKRKLSPARRQKLRVVLARTLKAEPDSSLRSVLRKVGKQFGVSHETVRWYLKDVRRPPAKKKGSSKTVKELLKKAADHRRMAKDLSKKHEKLAREFEQAARKIKAIEKRSS